MTKMVNLIAAIASLFFSDASSNWSAASDDFSATSRARLIPPPPGKVALTCSAAIRKAPITASATGKMYFDVSLRYA